MTLVEQRLGDPAWYGNHRRLIIHAMPELPEVETVVRDLRPRLIGRVIRSVRAGRKALRRRWSAAWGARLAGRRIESLGRRGKWIIVSLDGGVHLLIHLGMTGQLRVWPAQQPRQTHTHLIIDLDGADQLRFRDVRRFGSVSLFTDRASLDRFLEDSKLGPEPFDLQPACWRQRLMATERCLKAALLDQRLVAGVGNIYADESLFEARLSPLRRGCDLNAAHADRLRQAIIVVLLRAIEQRGSSIRDYLGGDGQPGNYQEEFRVYGRTGEPCSRCRTAIACMRLAGRSTHFCPRCQKQNPKSEPRHPKQLHKPNQRNPKAHHVSARQKVGLATGS
jgi:formamidopyrimidine-DNA glycosylase